MFKNIVMMVDCVIINTMSAPEAGLRVCILMDDGCKNFDAGCCEKGSDWIRSRVNVPDVAEMEALTDGLSYPLMVKSVWIKRASCS
jgi:hypothetical protein